ncbi:hypothetical protein TI39_contig397g00007 [Zymoseptoria brevis]|uniref:Uncharacterized protein n=1 Tax=Zymoseptoria brevis TaxID=1047168 RepID=A0A0F4GN86_9PEZI|nr:hypothetical protein TI39_contig397g00007 [Zymoseptoria brevis]
MASFTALSKSFLLRRDSSTPTDPKKPSSNGAPNTLTIALTVGVLVFALTAIIITAGFWYQRRRRARLPQNSALPYADEEDDLSTHDIEKRLSSLSTSSSSSRQHRRVLTRASKDDVYTGKPPLFMRSPSPPTSPIPEIRITFPEEIDEATGQRKSGCVVVVKVGEMGGVGGLEGGNEGTGFVGRMNDGERWQSVDLERVGGLVEKARNAPVRE